MFRNNRFCVGLNVTMTKKLSTFWEKKSAPPEKILATHMRKGPPPYIGMRLPEWLILPFFQISLLN